MKRGNNQFNNRLVYSLISLILLIIVVGGVYAYNPAKDAYHTKDYIDFTGGFNVPSGKVGIGTTSPLSSLEIKNGSLRLPASGFEGAGQIQSLGVVKFATGTSAQEIYVKKIRISETWTKSDANDPGDGGIYASGNVNVVGNVNANSFIYNSDISLKENIKPLANPLDKVNQLQGVSFNWKKDGRQSIGLIAQDVEKVLPELVHTNSEGLKSVEYGNIVALLIESIKEQQKEINTLREQIAELKTKLN